MAMPYCVFHDKQDVRRIGPQNTGSEGGKPNKEKYNKVFQMYMVVPG